MILLKATLFLVFAFAGLSYILYLVFRKSPETVEVQGPSSDEERPQLSPEESLTLFGQETTISLFPELMD